MTSTPTVCSEPRRRLLGLAALSLPGWALAQAAMAPVDRATLAALGEGGVVVVMRHALAPGTFDPPGFVLGQCATQRNLSDEGRAQAQRTGAWFAARQLRPARVRSSRWCRCQETARLAFGAVEDWPLLDSLIADRAAESPRTAALTQALAEVPAGRFEVWVTHQVNISALTGNFTGSGEGVVLRAGRAGEPPVVVVGKLGLA